MAEPAFSETPRPIVKAIETYYNGHKFRSRLEARWAVFLDVLDIGYRYEPEGYVVNGEPYLPDFYVPSLDAFLEIKSTLPRYLSQEDRVARGLAQGLEKMVYVQAGPLVPPRGFSDDAERAAQAKAYFPNGACDEPYLWCECTLCGFIGLEFDGRSSRLSCGCRRGDMDGKHYNWDSDYLMRAYGAASAMRFEFRR